ncbi:MAG: hypothetical protein IPL53_16010 [Ignavibacteria bacterium]|nr:hypothetical protein [Ignavibacteria bacterium]
MKSTTKLTIVKLIHTVIWLMFNVVIFYMLYAVIANKIDILVWAGIGIIILEGVVLTIFSKMCPLTLIARRYSDSDKANFDIFLPNWLAKYNKLIYTTIFIITLCILIYRIA